MPTLQQLIKKKVVRKPKYHKVRSPNLRRCPQKKGVCVRVYITKPKKPNSAQRRVAKLLITSTRRYATVYIPGQHDDIPLHEHSVVLIRGGRTKDLPGIKYKIVRGKYDSSVVEKFRRKQRRSKFSIKSELKK